MKIIEKALDGLVLFEPSVFGDHRGYFFESFKQTWLEDLNIKANFVQDNESFSSKNILRGLHFQAPPFEQGKIVRVTSGAVLDVAVDIRKESSTFGSHYKTVLSEENKRVLWVPPGFAHGFLTLKENTRFLYKCTNYYDKASEDAIFWNDEDLGIDWNCNNPILSDKDLENQPFKSLNSPF